MAQPVRSLPTMQKTQVRSQGWEDPLEKETATHSSILAWRLPWTEEPAGLQSMGSDTTGELHLFPLLVAAYRISKASCQILQHSSQTLVAAFRFSCSEACGILVPPTGLNPCPLQGRFLTTGLPRKSSNWQIFKNWISFTLPQWRSLGTSLHIVSWLDNYLQIFSEQELSPFYRPSIVPGAEDTKDSKA